MENRGITSYKLRAVHQSFDGNESECNTYERLLHVELLNYEQAVLYSPELKMNFENINKGSNLFEIETNNVQVDLCPRLKKAEDFIRRINYRYDWLQLRVRNDGKLASVPNRDEMKSTWKELRETLEGDYIGNAVEDFLKEADLWFQTDEHLHKPLYQYFYFALLFPQIPFKHNPKWENKRKIEFSEYEKEQFEETIKYVGTEKGIRQYRIFGNPFPESKVKIEKYEGTIYSPVNTLMVKKAEVEIRFCFSEIINQWNFELNKITSNTN